MTDSIWINDIVEEYDGQQEIISDGLEIFPDYKFTVGKHFREEDRGDLYYPVHIVNQTPNIKSVIIKDGKMYAIQEALSKDNAWHPIEGRWLDICGNGMMMLRIRPMEFFTFLMPKYEGDFKTMLRVRIKIQEYIYISQPFEGIINENQFLLSEKDGYHKRVLDYYGVEAIQNLFYGAIPLEYEQVVRY
jgi:hypothetical protein